jgi:AcrR family transcriptional regulator
MARGTKRMDDAGARGDGAADLDLGDVLDPDMSDAQRRIVQAAVSAFAEHGYNGTTTQEIARSAGVAEGTVFRYYRTKKELLLDTVGPLFMRIVSPIVRRNVETIFATEYPSFADFLRALVTDRLAFARSHRTIVRVMAQEIPFHPELRAQFENTVFNEVFARGLVAIERFQRRGDIAPLPPITVARICGSVFAGYILARVFLSPDAPWDDAAEVETMIGVLTRGLAPH